MGNNSFLCNIIEIKTELQNRYTDFNSKYHYVYEEGFINKTYAYLYLFTLIVNSSSDFNINSKKGGKFSVL